MYVANLRYFHPLVIVAVVVKVCAAIDRGGGGRGCVGQQNRKSLDDSMVELALFNFSFPSNI